MRLNDQLKQDISDFFRNAEKQLLETQKKSLLMLFDKYIHLSTTPVKLTKQDFEKIKSRASAMYVDTAFPKHFNKSSAKITPMEAANFCLVQATIDYLHAEDCIKKMPIFDIDTTK